MFFGGVVGAVLGRERVSPVYLAFPLWFSRRDCVVGQVAVATGLVRTAS